MSSEIKNLEQKIDASNVNYHAFGFSDISDAEYDSLRDRLAKLDHTNKRVMQIGTTITPEIKKSNKWEKYIHETYKMGSLDKVNTNDQLNKWVSSYEDYQYIIQEKLDGISIKLIYKNGNLDKAVSRGNDDSGVSTGEDITRNVVKMKGIHKTINFNKELIIRGEIILYKSKFENIGGKTLRNSAAGTAKGYDGNGCEYLNVKMYSIMNWKDLGFKYEHECLNLLKELNFDLVFTELCNTQEELIQVYNEYIKCNRKELDWDIDGLVIKIDELKDDKWDLPEHSIAYKFPHEKGVTKLIDVIWQDSGGRISPVGILEPILLNGVTISRVTLNNIDYINDLGIKINDLVIISRRNDVIPCIEGVSIKSDNGIPITPPSKDDEGYPIIREINSEGKELVYLVSTNPNSKHKRIRSILQWYKAHDAKGVAEETIDSIISANIVKSLPEFYDIGLNGHIQLPSVEGFGMGKFKILNKATLLTSETTIIKFIDGIGISGFSASRIEAILEHLNKTITLDEVLDICNNDKLISEIPGFGNTTALSIKNGLKERSNLIKEMNKRVKIQDWSPEIANKSNINGLSFCFTGKMVYDRGVLEKSVKKNSGIVSGVSKNLDYLVLNDLNSNSSKNQKAIKLNIKRISEEEYLNMIERNI